MSMPHRRKKSSCLPLVALGSVAIVVMVIAAGLTLKEMNPTCERVLLRWDRPTPSTDAEATADRRRRRISITEPTQEVHVDADLSHDTGFLNFSWSSVYLVRDGTPDDLVEEAIHPYGPTAGSTSDGSIPTTSPLGSVPTTRPRPQVQHEPGWRPAAIKSGDVVQVGSGSESINEDVALTAGDWYLAGDKIYRATILACA